MFQLFAQLNVASADSLTLPSQCADLRLEALCTVVFILSCPHDLAINAMLTFYGHNCSRAFPSADLPRSGVAMATAPLAIFVVSFGLLIAIVALFAREDAARARLTEHEGRRARRRAF